MSRRIGFKSSHGRPDAGADGTPNEATPAPDAPAGSATPAPDAPASPAAPTTATHVSPAFPDAPDPAHASHGASSHEPDGAEPRAPHAHAPHEPGMVRGTLELFARNWDTALLFELAYKLLLLFVIVPVEYGLATLAMRVRGMTYVADVNLARLLGFPTTWLFAAVMVLLLAMYVLYEMCALILLNNASRSGRQVTLTQLVRLSIPQVVRMPRRGNLLIVVFVLLIVPLTNIGLVSSAVQRIHVPEFIDSYIDDTPWLLVVSTVAFVALLVVAFRWLFSLHYFTLYGMTFKQARRSSLDLIRGNVLYVLVRLVAWWLAIGAAQALLSLAYSGLINVMAGLPGKGTVGAALLMGLFFVLTSAVNALALCLGAALTYAWLSQLFYRLVARRGTQEAPRTVVPAAPHQKVMRHRRLIVTSLIVVSVLTFAAVALATGTGMLNQVSWTQGCSVTAHRGGSWGAPENTLEAFDKAIDEGADWVELDVRQTKDGVLVVSHDSNTRRTTGVDRVIWDSTYDELKDLDNGSLFSSEYSSARICTLDQALTACKGRVRMNIELKPDGHTSDLERKAVDLIRAHDMADQVCVASVSYDCLGRVKAYDPGITTIYDMTVAFGNIAELKDADILSVDEAFVSPLLVDEAHEHGKQVFAWTVNEPDNMLRMYCYGVDSIVTDDVETALSVTSLQVGVALLHGMFEVAQ